MKSTASKTLDMTLIAIGAALIAVCSWLSIPLTVPVTMQTFAIFFIVVLLGGKRGTVSVLLYILLGAAGVPVFANFASGIGVLTGSTGGYILGFLPIGLFAWGAEKLFGRSFLVQTAALSLGLLLCYAFGTAWFMLIYLRDTGAVSLGTVLGWCVTPFILPDILKMILAQSIARKVAPFLRTETVHG